MTEPLTQYYQPFEDGLRIQFRFQIKSEIFWGLWKNIEYELTREVRFQIFNEMYG